MKKILITVVFCYITIAVSCNTSNKEATTSTNDTVGKIEIYDPGAANLIDTNATIEVIGKGYKWTEGRFGLPQNKCSFFPMCVKIKYTHGK